MTFYQRISAGGIVLHAGKTLLVRYRHPTGTFLVAPGGRMERGESLAQAAEREVFEETGVHCRATAPLMIDNLLERDHQMLKLWYLCDYLDGEAHFTPGAQAEGILSVGWFSDLDLANEIVFPEIIQTHTLAGLPALARDLFDPGVRTAEF